MMLNTSDGVKKIIFENCSIVSNVTISRRQRLRLTLLVAVGALRFPFTLSRRAWRAMDGLHGSAGRFYNDRGRCRKRHNGSSAMSKRLTAEWLGFNVE